MRKLFLLFSFGILFSCNQSEKPKPNFKYIDFSWGGGMTGGIFSVKLFADKNIYYKEMSYDTTKYKKCYIGKIDDSLFNFIIDQVEIVSKEKYDSNVDLRCSDCSIGNIIIQTDSIQKIAKIFFKFENNNTFYPLMKKLQSYPFHDKLISSDSCINYESLIGIFIPMLPKVINFIPPKIKSEK